jgi:hypothetical protein
LSPCLIGIGSTAGENDVHGFSGCESYLDSVCSEASARKVLMSIGEIRMMPWLIPNVARLEMMIIRRVCLKFIDFFLVSYWIDELTSQ